METIETLKELFKIGQKYTDFYIDSAMAMTHKREFTVKAFLPSGVVVIVPRGKRKEAGIRLEWQRYVNAPKSFYESALFDGWDQPVTCDTDVDTQPRNGEMVHCTTMRGNACYNFLGSPETVRTWIDKGQLNPLFKKEHVLAVNGNAEIVVYPELVKPGDHAVIDRVLQDQEV